MTRPALQPLTAEQFLEWDSGDDRGYELVDGEIVAMAPTLPAHQILAANFARRLAEVLDERPPCTVRVEAAIVPVDHEHTCHHADLAVTYRPHEPGQKATPEPVLIVEILSPTTESYDRKVKVPDYRAIPTVEEIVLIDPQQVYCEVYRRLGGEDGAEGQWLTDLLRETDARLRLASVGFDRPLSVLYANLALGA